MGWKCLPQVTGLVRGEPKPGAKHRSNGAAICGEAGKERHSASETLDRTRSKYNQYAGHVTGRECWEAMEERAAQYKVEGVSRSGKAFSRKLKSDAVIGWAMIFHPPEDVAAGWPKEKHKKFVRDSWAAMCEIEPRLFRRENIEMQAIHRDEGVEHTHVIGNALSEDGKYCGNLVDAALMVRVCEKYPAMMRARGWDIEDAELTDFSRMGRNPDGTYKDPEYRAQVKARKKGGRSVNQYAADKARDRQEAAARMYQDAGKALQDAQTALQDAEAERARVRAAAEEEAAQALKTRQEELDAREAQLEQKEQRQKAVARNVAATVDGWRKAGLLGPGDKPKTREQLRREFAQQEQQAGQQRRQERGHEFDHLL